MRTRSRSLNPSERRMVFLIMCVLVVSIGGTGVAFISYSWTSLQKARASLNWPVTEGRIVTSRFVRDGDGGRVSDWTGFAIAAQMLKGRVIAPVAVIYFDGSHSVHGRQALHHLYGYTTGYLREKHNGYGPRI